MRACAAFRSCSAECIKRERFVFEGLSMLLYPRTQEQHTGAWGGLPQPCTVCDSYIWGSIWR